MPSKIALSFVLLLAAITSFPEVLGKNVDKRCVNCTYRTYYTSASSPSQYTARDASVDGCHGNPCGVNAICQDAGGRPVCSCPPGHSGNPLTACNRGECLDNIDCRGDLQCKDNRCVNPCVGACGLNANCEPKNHVAVCSCPTGYRGDPFTSCHRVDPDEQCHPSPCGVNTKCEISNGVPTCSCIHGFTGNPLSGCRHECEHDGDCSARDTCSNYKCVPACQQCGIGATCNTVAGHRAVCECPKGYIGSPYTECRPECYGDSDCPSNRPACFYGICKNTCDGACRWC
uniref:Stabilin-2 n=1 Tax=Bactrocera latifrons TaxID=174628 RepID=A0A0K8UI27_BACLA